MIKWLEEEEKPGEGDHKNRMETCSSWFTTRKWFEWKHDKMYTKRTIKQGIGKNVLSFSELQLMFYEIANSINSRPIGVINNSGSELPNPKTSNDLDWSTNRRPQFLSIRRKIFYNKKICLCLSMNVGKSSILQFYPLLFHLMSGCTNVEMLN